MCAQTRTASSRSFSSFPRIAKTTLRPDVPVTVAWTETVAPGTSTLRGFLSASISA